MMKLIVLTCIAAFVSGQVVILGMEPEPKPLRKPVSIVLPGDDKPTPNPTSKPTIVIIADDEDTDDEKVDGISLTIGDEDIKTPEAEVVTIIPTEGPVLAEVEPLEVNELNFERIVAALEKGGAGNEANSFIDALKFSNLAGLVTNKVSKTKKSGLTIFIPNNKAFAFAIQALGLTPETLASNKPLLDTILLNHIIEGVPLKAADLLDAETSASTLAPGQDPITITGDDAEVTVTDQSGETAKVIIPDIIFRNLVFHVVDNIIIPILPEV